jgi:adenine-specific DNA-methyltransferase
MTLPDQLTVLDPACGSGVFLLEVLRELIARRYQGSVRLRGFDISPLSVAMARFCLAHAEQEARDAGFAATTSIEQRNALTDDWGSPDLILMNPPFVPWQSMDAADQSAVRGVMGPLVQGRVDKAMAFVLRAARVLRPSGALAAVLPTALLETSAGERWREELAQLTGLQFVGRFEGFGYFRASMVEPAFIVLQRKEPESRANADIAILIARETREDEALRAFRLFRHSQFAEPETTPEWEIFYTPAASFSPTSWLPRAHSEQQVVDLLLAHGVKRAGDLFEIRQGARTGANEVFLLSRNDVNELPSPERRFFRPAADNSTIRDGRLSDAEFVFYPYSGSGLLIKTEAELARAVPRYFESRLKPAKAKLKKRAGITPDRWWGLTREREWQRLPEPKLVSTYFGDRGSFAYDIDGSFVVVQGHAWFPKESTLRIADSDDPDTPGTVDFHSSLLPWAYLALLNSALFERLLSTVAPRVQGGQFNLSPRFISRVFLPDLFDDVAVPPAVVGKLAQIGERIRAGKPHQTHGLDELAARAYGLPRQLAAAAEGE